jgi:hypothetical protein
MGFNNDGDADGMLDKEATSYGNKTWAKLFEETKRLFLFLCIGVLTAGAW